MIERIVFAIVTLTAFFFFFRRAREIYRNIKLGRDEEIKGDSGTRFKNMMLIAFGQKKMFKNLLPAILHLFVYVAFLITQIELIEIFIDGFSGEHRILFNAFGAGSLGQGFYVFVIGFIEVLSILALVATFAFLARRNMLKVPRLSMKELKGWPHLDANLILLWEIFLVSCIFTMNTADMALHKGEYGFPISGLLMPIFSGMSDSALHTLERVGWWGHIIGVLGFLVYVPYSKHLHIMLAFPNTYFKRLKPQGEFDNMPEVTKEIKLMMNPDTAFAAQPEGEATELPKFGAKDVQDLSWKNLLDAYSCTECGRCTQQCPANQTGKKLSPRKIMMDTRDRVEEVGKNVATNGGEFKDDGKALLKDYISVEELRACTTCMACVEACPVSINPLDIILLLRRNLILEESNSPEEWNVMFTNIENNGAPWQFSQQDRFKWADELKQQQ